MRAGQTLAELDSKSQLEAAQREAAARIEVARQRLAQVRAGAKPSDVAAKQAEIERLKGELSHAEQEHKRYASLGENVTVAQLESLKIRVDSTSWALTAARAQLASLTAVRQVDVNLARAELDEAVRNEARVRRERDASVLLSPIDGRVVKIHARPGEQVQASGVLELTPVGPMYVVAEVPDSDIGRVRVGQRATITANALGTPVTGTVDRIEMRMLQNQLAAVDPASFSDGHVVNCWIRVDDSHTVPTLIGMRVDVVIQP